MSTQLMIQWLINNQDLATLLFTGVVALSTVVYAALTAFLAIETARMRRAQTEPKLSVYFKPVDEHVNFGHLYIENIGLGPAYDIKPDYVPSGSVEGCNKLLEDFFQTKSFERGVNYLGPSQILRSRYTSMTDDYEEKIKATLIITLSYKCADKSKRSETFRIDFAELEGYGTFGTPNLYSIAKSIEKMQKDFHHVATGFYKPKLHTFDHQDRERERDEMKTRLESIIKDKDKGDGDTNA